MDTPASIEEAVSETVIRRLETALGDRGLLLSADELTAAEADAAQQGSRLLGVVIDRCYPESSARRRDLRVRQRSCCERDWRRRSRSAP